MSDHLCSWPIEFVHIEFPGDQVTGVAAAALLDLVGRGIIRSTTCS